jgi:formylmethanofuran--tetrahydromethanopterin N-formyltransferase
VLSANPAIQRRNMRIGPTEILDTYAEAFHARYARLIITAADEYWLDAAVRAFTGYGTSVIGCDAEVGVETLSAAWESPDGRPAAALLLFAFSTKSLAEAVGNRIGQCVLTCPTTAGFNGLVNAKECLPLGDHVRFFGDGFETSGTLHGRQVWRVPVMDGEFLVERTAGIGHGIAGGNIILQSESQPVGLAAALRAAKAVSLALGVIAPFPGGICRSGSKVGSKYKSLVASTHEKLCPTLRQRVDSQLVKGAACAYEIVINGVDETAVSNAMRLAIEAAAGEGVLAIDAGNYAGRLGKVKIGLRQLFE